MKRFLALLALALSFFLAGWGQASAQQRTPTDDEVNAIARTLYCPVCENTPLDVCPTPACHDWRELIRQMLAEGKPPAEIRQYFVDHYGARVLSAPPAQGFNWLVYVVPPVVFLVGIFLLFQSFRLWRGQTKEILSDDATHQTAPGDDEYIRRLEQELEKRE
jgi:cytochrome c-type biogenesis protein CcmH